MAPVIEARRFLHCCYCCRDAETASQLFSEGLGLEERMRSADGPVDGRQMGFPGNVVTDARFVYDKRGSRVSPAIEVQQWIDPPTVGEPYFRPNEVGFQALGVGVKELTDVIERLTRFGCTQVEDGPLSTLAGAATTMLDPTGVNIDLLEADGLEHPTQLVHLRATCSNLERSIAWYATLGFEVVARTSDARSSFARLRLPDEPFALILTEWHDPPSQGRPYDTGNHAGLYRFAIAVDDTRTAYDALLHAGWPLMSPPQSVQLGGTTVPDMWIAFLEDPDGLVVELVERPRSAFKASGSVAPPGDKEQR
jgi:catechol 2,3-dioxygenase-like lactoylglutathione lyase family enzyme